MLEEKMLRQKVWTVVGVGQDQAKYANKIYYKLKQLNYRVYAVNPLYDSIEGDPIYPSLAALPEKPDVVNLVVAPRISEKYLREAAGLGIKHIWLQPGTHDLAVLELANELGLEAVQACVLVAARHPFAAENV